ncbi:EGF-like domain-containing protein 1 [Aplysia californica]|uniref:EGF-like domain-containing protein 1 n=1 Tax=Aplysia californica TaxID=6500 RepID=A0ABM1VQT3_APLCA|nr:EGF-like domain-containing protein 1 [Aplysia californica]XP_012936110.1 EGF-like domain-containing protein 1 [Aplysia californica]XP_012936111.1 EGF-like domain-containing protein 1 [Aplysia californica]XP_012936114.1 EGF-like domain-containing protein 1 [Aplysia californica]XP_012936115.1 EGF-like domain-containing protein 1 [Aplysia californica]XP_012936116.1 EGF-like domain-containing protein 1 [Aplysia californica]XP_035824775.1 EGF-like domain-containing protein 1 [Aplysia californic
MAPVGRDHMTTIILLATFVVAASAQAVLDFDCRRQGAQCDDGAKCDVTQGDCDCATATTGTITTRDYKCGDNSESGTCTALCENSGVCVLSMCNCPESYYGDRCQMNRVQVDCDGSSMFLNVNPDVNTFSGTIFVVGQETTPGCNLTAGTGGTGLGNFIENKDDLDGYRIQLEHTGSGCGDITPEDETENGVTYKVRKRQFLVRHSVDFMTSLDQVITSECRRAEGSTQIYSTASVVEQNNNDFTDVNVDSDVETVTMAVQNADGSPISDPVQLGADMMLVFTLAAGSGFEDFHVSSCEANNTEADTESKTLQFIEDSCPSATAYSLFRSGLTKEPAAAADDPVVVKVNMKVFRFLGSSDKVAFVCDIVLCDAASDPQCADKECSGVVASDATTSPSTASGTTANPLVNPQPVTQPTTQPATPANPAATNPANSGRKKRAAGDHQRVDSTITVYDPAEATGQAIKKLEEKIAEKECMNQPEIVACIAVLAVAVVLLLLLSIILVLRLMRSRQKVASSQQANSVRPVETMRIPRLELHHPYNQGC